MKKSFALSLVLLVAAPLSALTADGPVAPAEQIHRATDASGCATVGAPGGEHGTTIGSTPLLDLVVPGAVAQAGCADFTPCITVDDCPCQAPDCACVPVSGCRFTHICLCQEFCFGGQQP